MFNKRIIFEAVVGSQLYGIATPTSDIDYRGVCIEDAQDIYGLTPMSKPYEDDAQDRTIYGLKQFAELALGSNPNIVEMFFADKNIVINPQDRRVWNMILEHQFDFISKKVTKTFIGYVVSQRKRMDTHHDWMTGKPPVKPVPEDYGMIYDSDGTPRWTDNNAHQAYDNRLKDYQSYATWLANRNEKRHKLEKDYGYDTKHGSHIVRLLAQVKELHLTGMITFPRPEARLLLNIRNGGWTYNYLIDWMTSEIDTIENFIHPKSVLPEKPNPALVDRLLMDIYQKELIIDA